MNTPTTNRRDPSNLAYAAMIGTTVAVVFLTALIIWAELHAPVKDWLKSIFGHHWVGKSVLAAVIFFLSGALVSGGRPKSEDDLAASGQAAFVTTVIAMVVLLVFYLYEALLRG